MSIMTVFKNLPDIYCYVTIMPLFQYFYTGGKELDKIVKFLNENVVCSLATCKDNVPRATAMEYVMAEGHIIFATDPDSIKARNLKANNKISFSAQNMPLFVTIDGTTETPTEQEIAAYNKTLFERHPEFNDAMAAGMMRPFQYYKIVPKTAYWNDYSAGMPPTEIIEY